VGMPDSATAFQATTKLTLGSKTVHKLKGLNFSPGSPKLR